MKKKWLCLALFLCLLMLPLLGVMRFEAEDRLARALTAAGARLSREELLELGRAALSREDVVSPRLAIDMAFEKRSLVASPRARDAARELM